MTDLRKRFTQDLQLHGYSERTQEMYLRAVRQLADHYNKSPDRISEEELRDYFLYNKNIRKWCQTENEFPQKTELKILCHRQRYTS